MCDANVYVRLYLRQSSFGKPPEWRYISNEGGEWRAQNEDRIYGTITPCMIVTACWTLLFQENRVRASRELQSTQATAVADLTAQLNLVRILFHEIYNLLVFYIVSCFLYILHTHLTSNAMVPGDSTTSCTWSGATFTLEGTSGVYFVHIIYVVN